MLGFVVGTGRCGTTLVQEVVARHAGVGFVSNIDDKLSHLDLVGRWNSTLYRRATPRDPSLRPFRDRRRLAERGRLRVAPSEGWNLLDRQIAPMFSQPYRDLLATDVTLQLERRTRSFFERRIEAQGCEVFLHRLTGWPRTGFLREVFPDAKFVHVVRDGRAVSNSWLQMGWWDGYRGVPGWYLGPLPDDYLELWHECGESFAALAGLGWRLLLDAFEEARALVPAAQWLDVRYEDVLTHPREEFARILDFLGLAWTPEFERGLQRHDFDATRGDAFRRDLRPSHVAEIERVTAPRLEQWGYVPRTGPQVAPLTVPAAS